MKEPIPYFSICVPTRNRPNFVEIVLYALSKQTFKNFEVIISDNSDNKTCLDIVEKYKKNIDIRLLIPKTTYTHIENFEFTISHASGQYIIFNLDKMYLYPYALERIHKLATKGKEKDIITLSLDGISSIDSIYEPCKLNLNYYQNKSKYYSPLKTIKSLISSNLSLEHYTYYFHGYGNIMFSFISSKIVKKIIDNFGRYFFPTSVDYSSIILPLFYAKNCLKINISMGAYNNNKNKSIGHSISSDYLVAKKFIKQTDKCKTYENSAIFPNFLTSKHNFIISDMVRMAKACNFVDKNYITNEKNLLINIYNDFKVQKNSPKSILEEIEVLFTEISPLYLFLRKIRIALLTKFSPKFIKNYFVINTFGRVPVSYFHKLYKHRAIAKNVIHFNDFYSFLEFANDYYLHQSKLLEIEKK